MSLFPGIFKAYDIRGVYPHEFDEAAARWIGQAFVAHLNAHRIAVGRDMRLSSGGLAAAFIEGATTQGADVVDYGLIGTDMLYYAVIQDEFDGGAEITASHNPKDFNGIKLVGPHATALSGDAGISDIRDMIASDSIPTPGKATGTVAPAQLLDRYLSHVLSFIDVNVIKPFKLVLDAGSGMAGLVAPKLFDALPCHTTRLCFEIDGSFPNHEANPLIENNRRDLVEAVIETHADAGIAWDGDADRCFFVDGEGRFVPGDFITTLLAESFLLKSPGAPLLYDVRARHAVPDIVARHKGTSLMNRVGHAFFKNRMRDTDAIFGGEVTGHYYFRDNGFADNGFIPALLILELMSRKHATLSELLAPLRERYFLSGEINTNVHNMTVVAAKIEQLAARYTDGVQYRMDGLSVEYPDWHFNVRPSNTEALLRLNLEGATPELMTAKRDEVLTVIREP